MIIIGTHSGRFHADEALAIALLSRHVDTKDKPLKVIRSRDPLQWAECDYLVDVGGEYDNSAHRYDHHQASFNDRFSPDRCTILSSAGLIYRHFGADIISQTLADPVEGKLIYDKIYQRFIETFDAVDNGVERCSLKECCSRYAKPHDIFAMVSDLNPEWNEQVSEEQVLARFMEAVELCGKAFDACLRYYCKSWLPARNVVKQSILKSLANPRLAAAQTLHLEQVCPWKDHLFELEKELSCTFLYCIYREDVGGGWRIQAVPAALETFECRQALPLEWRGLRDADLDRVVGGSGAVFCHKTGFIGGHKEMEGIVQMAEMACTK